MIIKNPSLVRSENILNSVIHDSRTENLHCYAECYQNGREQGFQIWGYQRPIGRTKTVLFSEGRSSDCIAVYVGEYANSSISEDAYKNQHQFSSCEEAVEFIIKTI